MRYGIDDKPFHRLLITDCGGYKNLAKSITSFGLIKSNEEVTNTYKQAVSMYLNQKYSACEISNFDDLGEIFCFILVEKVNFHEIIPSFTFTIEFFSKN